MAILQAVEAAERERVDVAAPLMGDGQLGGAPRNQTALDMRTLDQLAGTSRWATLEGAELATFRQNAPGRLAADLEAVLFTPAGIAVQKVRDEILTSPRTAVAHTTLGAWLDASGTRIGGLRQLESGAASDQTRRRIERDLHDRVQQRLVSLGLALRAAQRAMPPGDAQLGLELTRVADGITEALEELREMSRGIHPAILSQGGLGPALKALARRSAVPVQLDVQVQARLPERAEVAAYFVVSEALANVAKHAQASVVQVRVEVRDGTLHRVDPGRRRWWSRSVPRLRAYRPD